MYLRQQRSSFIWLLRSDRSSLIFRPQERTEGATIRKRMKFTLLASRGKAGCRCRQIVAHRGSECHRIERLGQHALSAQRDVLLDLIGLGAGGQEYNWNVGSPRILAQVGKRCRSVHELSL